MKKYTETEIQNKLEIFKGWEFTDGFLIKTFTFKDFGEAFGFLGRVALISERLDHHANWSGVYNVVTLKLKTYDVDGISDKDFSFVYEVEKMF